MIEGLFKKVSSVFTPSGKDRRRHARFVCSNDTLIRYTEVTGKRDSIPGTINNISASGALFYPHYDSQYELPDHYEYHLYVGSNPKAIKIIRVSFNGFHCQFLDNINDEEMKRFLREYGIRR